MKKPFVKGNTISKGEKAQLDALEQNLSIEIELASSSILRMEALLDRYFVAANEAKKIDNMGHYIRYQNAYERLMTIVNARYAPFRPVTDDGRLNVH